MSWVDVISAALGAAGQGLDQQTQVSRQRQQFDMQAQEAELRRRKLEQDALLQTVVPGQELDPTTLETATRLGFKHRIGKNDAGAPFWMPSLEDQRQTALTQDAEAKAEMSAKALKARELIESDPESFLQQPYEKQLLMRNMAGLEGQWPRSLEDQIELAKANDFLPYQAALARSNGSGNTEMNELRKAQQAQIYLKLLEHKYGTGDTIGRARLEKDPARFAEYQRELQQLLQQAQGVAEPQQNAQGETVSVVAPTGEVRHGIPVATARAMVAAGGRIVK